MQTIFVYLLVLVMPDGEQMAASRIVDACPDVKTVYFKYETMKQQGSLYDWNANCFQVQLEAHKEET